MHRFPGLITGRYHSPALPHQTVGRQRVRLATPEFSADLALVSNQNKEGLSHQRIDIDPNIYYKAHYLFDRCFLKNAKYPLNNDNLPLA